MKETSESIAKKSARSVKITVLAVVLIMISVSLYFCYHAVKAENHARYVGIKNVASERIAKVIRGIEISANNIFEEVEQHLDSPEDVIAALRSKVHFNLDVRGYFAAFTPNYFPEQGKWFEPYIYQPDVVGFEYRQVGSESHDYTQSPWYVRAKDTQGCFWSEPYYYDDGTSMSGHYCTFVKPIYDLKGDLACVCGADMTFEWLAKELGWVDVTNRANNMQNQFHVLSAVDFYTVILNSDGTCVAHPDEKNVTITDEGVLRDLALKKSGTIDMEVNGESCTVYYGPIEYIDWSVAIVVPKVDLLKPLFPVALILLLTAAAGIFIVMKVCRRLEA